MQLRPATSPSDWGSGVKSRFDDFVASHIVQALDVHSSGIFMGYHRWIVVEFERAMREECESGCPAVSRCIYTLRLLTDIYVTAQTLGPGSRRYDWHEGESAV